MGYDYLFVIPAVFGAILISYKTPGKAARTIALVGCAATFGSGLALLSGPGKAVGLIPALVSSALMLLICIYAMKYFDDTGTFISFAANGLLVLSATNGLFLADDLGEALIFWVALGYLSRRLMLVGRAKGDRGPRTVFRYIAISDALFMVGVLWLKLRRYPLDMGGLEGANGWELQGALLLIVVSLLVRSAQFPFHTWLPGAMESPGPVSSLLDAATLLNSGAFLWIWLRPLASKVPWLSQAVGLCAVITILLGGYRALKESDLKKMLAYSTMSQLGFVFLGTSLDAGAAPMLHLIFHAAFKALLFMSASWIQHMYHTRDLSKLGGALRGMPSIAVPYLVGTAALTGIPFTCGFFSKDLIIHASLERSISLGILPALGASLTFAYAWGAALKLLQGQHAHGHHVHCHQPPWQVKIVLTTLAVVSLLAWLGVGPITSMLARSGVCEGELEVRELLRESFALEPDVCNLLIYAVGIIIAWELRHHRDDISWQNQ